MFFFLVVKGVRVVKVVKVKCIVGFRSKGVM